MLKRPKHLPVYVMSYHTRGKIKETTIVAKISDANNKQTQKRLKECSDKDLPIFTEYFDWDGKKVLIETIEEIYHYPNPNNCDTNTFLMENAKLVSKDTWIKQAKKINKLIDEKNKKEKTSIPRVSY